MNPRFEAAWELHQFFAENQIPYAMIGGSALPRWGEPRFTTDVDLVVLPALGEGVAPFVRLLLSRFAARRDDAIEFARKKRVVLIKATNQCDVDISIGIPGYESEVISRATDYELAPNKIVRVCSADDLIILKCFAGRPQDLVDVKSVILRQRKNLDLDHIRKWLAFFDQEMPEASGALQRFETAWGEERRLPDNSRGNSQALNTKHKKGR